MSTSHAVCIRTSFVTPWVAACLLTVPGALAQPYGSPLPGLTADELVQFELGRAAFATDFTPAEGLGPLFEDTSCGGCHSSPATGGGSTQLLVYLGTPDGEPLIWPTSGVLEGCEPELPDGASEAPHITSPAFGAGFVDAIPDAAIMSLADPDDADGDGISGRAQLVVALEDPLGPPRAGRFGHKAQGPTLLSFSAVMLRDVLGITNGLLPTELDPSLPPACDAVADPEDAPDASGVDSLQRMTDFQRLLAAPPQWPPQGTLPGEAIFEQIGCATCHVPAWTTGPSDHPALANQVFHPYGDWLVHDIGTGDGLASAAAGGNEMRTAPLWGLRHRAQYMHHGCVSLRALQTITFTFSNGFRHGGPISSIWRRSWRTSTS